MRTASRIFGFGILGLLALAWALQLSGAVGAVPRAARGEPAPDFRLRLLDGGEFRLAAAPGSVTLIDFWATWCGPCRAELPRVDALHRRFRDRGLRVVAVNVESDEARRVAARLVDELKLEMPVALDGADVAEQYRVSALPQAVLVDRAGRVQSVLVGVQGERELAAAVEAALK